MKTSQDTAAIVEAAVEELAATLERADSSSGRLSSMIRTMEEVAFQTNLLALNAAVEAAQPGQAQAGYKVLAGDLRDLAEHSALAAREAADLIEEAVTDVSTGADDVLQVADAMKRNAEVGLRVTALVDRINAANRGPTGDLSPPSVPPPPTAAMRVAVRQIHLLSGYERAD